MLSFDMFIFILEIYNPFHQKLKTYYIEKIKN